MDPKIKSQILYSVVVPGEKQTEPPKLSPKQFHINVADDDIKDHVEHAIENGLITCTTRVISVDDIIVAEATEKGRRFLQEYRVSHPRRNT